MAEYVSNESALRGEAPRALQAQGAGRPEDSLRRLSIDSDKVSDPRDDGMGMVDVLCFM